MWPYWMLYLLPAALAMVSRSGAPHESRGGRALDPAWILAAAFIALLVGYRYEVGGDWPNYLRFLDLIDGAALEEALRVSDPGYALLGWLSLEMGWGIVGVNLIGGAIFAVGLVQFCRSLPRPWLALAVAVPYLVIVVGMGYSRQGIALSLSLLGLLALLRQSRFSFVVWVVLGATFHKTAVLLLPIAALCSTRNRYWTVTWVVVLMAVAYVVLLEDAVESLYENYIEAEYQSEGAFIRLLMNAIPAALLLFNLKRFSFTEAERSLWKWFSLISLALFSLLLVTSASTAVDRVALYMLPLQLVVFSQLPNVLGHRGGQNQQWVLLILLYYAAVLFVWLNFADHSMYWLPYRFYLIQT